MIVTFLPARGRAISQVTINKVPWCVALDIMLRRSYARIAYLKSLVLHKDQVIRPAGRGDKNGADLGLKCTPSDWALWAGRAGAPEALPPTRDDLPVVDTLSGMPPLIHHLAAGGVEHDGIRLH